MDERVLVSCSPSPSAGGEVNGFTGLLGSGRSECVRATFGADHITGGTVKMDDHDRGLKSKSPWTL